MLAASTGVRIALLGIIAGLLVAIGFLTAQLLSQRKKTPPPPREQQRRVQVSPPTPVVTPFVRRATGAPSAGMAGGATEVATAAVDKAGTMPLPGGPMACPTCRREFDAGVRFCPHDSRRLVPAAEVAGRRPPQPATGVIAKICPKCRNRYDLATAFCGKDGAELVTIN